MENFIKIARRAIGEKIINAQTDHTNNGFQQMWAEINFFWNYAFSKGPQ